MTIPRPRWSNQTKLLVIVCLLIGAGYVLYKFSVALPPLILAVILAYVLSPFVNTLHTRFRIPRGLAIFLSYLLVILIITAILMVIIPLLINQLGGLTTNIEGLLSQAARFFDEDLTIAGFVINGQALLSRIIAALESAVEPVLGGTIDVVTTVLELIVWIVFILVISVYLIKDSQSLRKWFSRLIPPVYRSDADRLINEINTIWSSFFRGQLILSILVTGIISIEGLIIGMPFALVMGFIAGLMEFLPSVGHGIWLVLALLVGFFGGSTWLPLPNWAFAILILILHIIFTQFDLNYLIPRIIGRSVHLPPLVVILGIVAGASLMGVLGVVLAAPSIASLRVLLRYAYAQIFDLEPFGEESTTSPLPPPDPLWWQKHSVRLSKKS